MGTATMLAQGPLEELPTLISVSTRAGALIVLVGILVVLLDLVLVRWLKLGKVAWKRADYVWLTIAALGLIKAAADSRSIIATSSLHTEQTRASGSLRSVRAAFDPDRNPWLFTKFARSEYSPQDFAEIQRDIASAGDWQRSTFDALPTSDAPPFVALHVVEPPVVAATHTPIIEAIQSMRRAIDGYEFHRVRSEQLEALVPHTPGEEANLIVAPLLLSVALAVRFVKVRGEVVLERRPVVQATTARARRLCSLPRHRGRQCRRRFGY